MKITIEEFNNAFKNNNLKSINWDELSQKNILSIINYNFCNQIIIKLNPTTFIKFLEIIKNSPDNNDKSFEFIDSNKEEYLQLSKNNFTIQDNIQKLLNLYMGQRISYTKKELENYINILTEFNIDKKLITKWCAKILVYTCENNKKEIKNLLSSGKLLDLINENNNLNKGLFLNQVINKSNDKTLDLLNLIYENYTNEIQKLYKQKLSINNIWESLKIIKVNKYIKEEYISSLKNKWLASKNIAVDFNEAPYMLIDIYDSWRYDKNKLDKLIDENKKEIINCIKAYEKNDNLRYISKSIISKCFEDEKFYTYIKSCAFQKELENIIPKNNINIKKFKL